MDDEQHNRNVTETVELYLIFPSINLNAEMP